MGQVRSANPPPLGAHSCRKWALVPSKGKEQIVGPEGQDGHGAGALACFLIILSGPLVGGNFKKTLS